MPNIILKKTFKIKPSGFKVANEKSFTFHGRSMDAHLIAAINQELAHLHLVEGANRLKFKIREDSQHYFAPMNHNFQKHHEEDAVGIILDAMEQWGWDFSFQYDTEQTSRKGTGDSITQRELFLFHKGLNQQQKHTTLQKASAKKTTVKEKMSSKSEQTSSTRATDDSLPPPLTKLGAKSEQVSAVRKSK